MLGSDAYQLVTDRVIAMLEAGTRPWECPWGGGASGARPLRHDGTPYRGVNVLNLWIAGHSAGHASPYWLTFKRAQELGGRVRKGERAERAFYVGRMSRERDNGAGELEEYTVAFLKNYAVFNACQVEGLPAHYYQAQEIPIRQHARHEAAEAFISGTGARVNHAPGRAYYHRLRDDITLPPLEHFREPAGYYSTLLHELAHWTGAPARLDRTKGKVFGDPAYAFEELVAELSAAYLCADLGVSLEPREDHAAYIASWLQALRDDNRAIFRAAGYAERACGFLHQAAAGQAPAAPPIAAQGTLALAA